MNYLLLEGFLRSTNLCVNIQKSKSGNKGATFVVEILSPNLKCRDNFVWICDDVFSINLSQNWWPESVTRLQGGFSIHKGFASSATVVW